MALKDLFKIFKKAPEKKTVVDSNDSFVRTSVVLNTFDHIIFLISCTEDYALPLCEFIEPCTSTIGVQIKLMQSSFDEELEKLDEKLEEALDSENMAQIVADALTTGLVSVGDEVIRLDQLMADFAVESEGAITALSNTIRAEMIVSLREASELVNDLGMSYQALIGYNETLTQNRAAQNVNNANSRSVAPSIEFNAPILTVEGDITQDVDSRLSELANQVEQTVLKTVTRALSTI